MRRSSVSWYAVAVLVITCVTSTPAAGQTTGAPARTPWGHPDLQGTWNFNTNTPLERAPEMGTRRLLTDAELAAREEAAKRALVDTPPRDGDPGTYNRFWTDQPRADRRTSMIVDPPDGRLPPLTAAAQTYQAELKESRRAVQDDAPTPGGWVTEIGPHGLSVRCIVGFNAGPPMTGRSYNANLQIFQTPHHVVLLNEMIHTARIIPIDGRPHLSSSVRQWSGDSRGRWDGSTLIVETTNFNRMVSDFANDRPAGPQMRIIERFTRTDADTVLYQFTVDDPSWFTKPWTAEIDMARTEQRLFEYACHEGNVSVLNILAGARAADNGETHSSRR
jgi:hypothetical protein